jgi:hypothetical protein
MGTDRLLLENQLDFARSLPRVRHGRRDEKFIQGLDQARMVSNFHPGISLSMRREQHCQGKLGDVQ